MFNDLDAIERLWTAGEIDGGEFRKTVRSAIESEDATARGTALYVLLVVEDFEALDRALPDLLNDDTPVVVRRAAEVAGGRERTDLLNELCTRAKTTEDELARRALSQAAAVVAPKAEIKRVVAELPASESEYVLGVVANRLTRDEQLDILESQDAVDERWVEHLLRSDEPWSEEQIRVLARLIRAGDLSTSMYLTEEAGSVLLQQPRAALEAVLEGELSAHDV